QPVHSSYPDGRHLASGEDYSSITSYSPARCRPAGHAGLDERRSAVFGPYPQGTARVFATSTRLKSNRGTTFGLALRTEGAWMGDDVGGTYHLRMVGQPTLQPVRVRVSVGLPSGMGMTYANVPIILDHGHLVWKGVLGQGQDIEIKFERPLLDKIWRRTWDFLRRPVFRIG